MKCIVFSLLFICVICISSINSTPARNVPIPSYPQSAPPPYYNQGLQYGDLGCCRSSFPGIKTDLDLLFLCHFELKMEKPISEHSMKVTIIANQFFITMQIFRIRFKIYIKNSYKFENN